MDHDEMTKLENTEIANMLNDLLAQGKTKDEAEAELGLTAPDLTKQNVFFMDDKYLAR